MNATRTVTHPAKFSGPIVDVLRGLAVSLPGPILDPFAGTGRIHDLGRDDTVGIEIEKEWSDLHERTYLGDALALPYPDESFGSIVTSPTYGNRMADTYAGDGTRRHTYRIALGRDLSPGSSAGMQWGDQYRDFHVAAWTEAVRVLRPGGRFVLNISDHVRKGVVQPVSDFHRGVLKGLGLRELASTAIETARNRHGANGDLRVDHEWIFVFGKPETKNGAALDPRPFHDRSLRSSAYGAAE